MALTLRTAFPLFNVNAAAHSPPMLENTEPPLAPMTEDELEAGLDRFSDFVQSTPPEKLIEWFDEEASDLLDGLWAACGERLGDDEWDAMFALLPRIYALLVPSELERYEIDAERLAASFATWEKPGADFAKSRQPRVMEDILTLLADIIEHEPVFHGPSKQIAIALLAATVDELDRTVCESKEEDPEDLKS